MWVLSCPCTSGAYAAHLCFCLLAPCVDDHLCDIVFYWTGTAEIKVRNKGVLLNMGKCTYLLNCLNNLDYSFRKQESHVRKAPVDFRNQVWWLITVFQRIASSIALCLGGVRSSKLFLLNGVVRALYCGSETSLRNKTIHDFNFSLMQNSSWNWKISKNFQIILSGFVCLLYARH